MRKPVMWMACLLFTGAQAQEVNVGDTVRGEIALGNWAVRRTFPLPAGDWRVMRVRDVDGTRTAVENNQARPRSVEVVLVQAEGRDLVMMMRIQTLREQTAIRRWTEMTNPCEQKDKYLHSNSYDSNVWTTKCLTAEQVNGFLGANTAYADAREWLTAEKLRYSGAPLSAQLVRYGDYHALAVRFWTNPTLRKVDVRKEPERAKYVGEFIAWSESYMRLILDDPAKIESIPAFR